MRPTGDVLGGRSCKDIEGVPSNSSSIYAPPTSFFLASEDMVEKRYEQAVNRGNSSMFGVESLQETTYDPPLGDDQKIIESDNYNRGDHGTRRRSTLKPNERERDGSLESNEHILRTYTEETSPPLACHRLVLPHSTSESLASMSQNSHVQGVSSPSSLKSISTPSFRHSDEESMDEATSQAITSSGEDETDLPDEIQDSSPQLIMPSIKMPSRRPFTERGKKLGLLKILIAGDSGTFQTHTNNFPFSESTKLTKASVKRLSSSQSCRPVKTSSMSTHYPPIFQRLIISGKRTQRPGERSQTLIQLIN